MFHLQSKLKKEELKEEKGTCTKCGNKNKLRYIVVYQIEDQKTN